MGDGPDGQIWDGRSGLTARLMYGYILSNRNVLTAAETSFALIARLVPQDVCFLQVSS